MLNEMVQNKNDEFDTNQPDSIINANELLDHARSLVMKNDNSKKSDKSNSDQQRIILLQKLDRMIKTIKEHHEQESNKNNVSNMKNHATNLEKIKCKSLHDISTIECESPDVPIAKQPCLSTPQLSRLSISKRPKSSYGRPRLRRSISREESVSNNNKLDDSKSMKKTISLANVHLPTNDDDNDDEIKSLDGESFSDSDDDNHNDELKTPSPVFPFSNKYYYNTKKTLFAMDIAATSSSSGSSGSGSNKKYYAFDKRFIKTSTSDRQRVKMILRYNGLNGATNMGGKRNVKVYQQITVGGNSILIYDGSIKPGETFTFDIRPHINNSFAINILVNGIRDLRLNTCCEHKHRPGTTLSHFTIINVIGGRACFNCQMMFADYNDHYNHTHQNRIQTSKQNQQEINGILSLDDHHHLTDHYYDDENINVEHSIKNHNNGNHREIETPTTPNKIQLNFLPSPMGNANKNNEQEQNEQTKKTFKTTLDHLNSFVVNNKDGHHNDNDKDDQILLHTENIHRNPNPVTEHQLPSSTITSTIRLMNDVESHDNDETMTTSGQHSVKFSDVYKKHNRTIRFDSATNSRKVSGENLLPMINDDDEDYDEENNNDCYAIDIDSETMPQIFCNNHSHSDDE
uniref:Probable serine/threonine-protein kinase DDB_G0282963 n=1 Tax=Dermatophagoides pteronyssinus TaxID=6956 RepID=A0A6P6YEQ5_DERPT|nr:probable serine/threonine-protein kinase DDB_G0282963 [Dermatophagoides pteronyssinus]